MRDMTMEAAVDGTLPAFAEAAEDHPGLARALPQFVFELGGGCSRPKESRSTRHGSGMAS